MTVKELKEILEACNNDAEVYLMKLPGLYYKVEDENVFQTPDGTAVCIPVDAVLTQE